MKQRAMAIAIATVLVAAGFSIAPSVQAGHTNCHEDFQIADSKTLAQSRELGGGESEIGVEDVSATGGDEDVTVELTSTDDKLEFTIREDSSGCQSSNNVSSSCQQTVVLDTTDSDPGNDQETCTLQAPSSGDRMFYFEFVNAQENDPLEYIAYVS